MLLWWKGSLAGKPLPVNVDMLVNFKDVKALRSIKNTTIDGLC